MENEMKFIEMKQSDIKPLKERLWLKNNKTCPLLGIEIPLDKISLDHIHKLNSESYSEQKGTIRDGIEFRANSLEGKITNNWKRYFGSDESKHPTTLPNFLRKLADYLERGAYSEIINGEEVYYVHPTEVPKEPKLMKSSYNELKRVYNEKKKFPDFPKSGKMTNVLKNLFEKYEIIPKFYTVK